MRDLLCKLDQEFLVHHYSRWSAAEALASDETARRLAASWYGGCGPNRASFDTDSRGIHYTMPTEIELGLRYNSRGVCVGIGRAHTVTWTQIRRHRLAQPTELLNELTHALAAHQKEATRHWEASHAIAKNGYWRATPEQITQLDEETQRHLTADHGGRDRVWSAVDEILPLATALEPSDLIEWAEALR